MWLELVVCLVAGMCGFLGGRVGFCFILFWGLLFFGCVGLGFQEKVRPCCENVILCVRCRPVLLSLI